jgi:hypothetical protein
VKNATMAVPAQILVMIFRIPCLSRHSPSRIPSLNAVDVFRPDQAACTTFAVVWPPDAGKERDFWSRQLGQSRFCFDQHPFGRISRAALPQILLLTSSSGNRWRAKAAELQTAAAERAELSGAEVLCETARVGLGPDDAGQRIALRVIKKRKCRGCERPNLAPLVSVQFGRIPIHSYSPNFAEKGSLISVMRHPLG